MKSIYGVICDNMNSAGFLPENETLKLPDHERLDADLRENWVPGEFESVMVRLPYRIKEMSFINYMIARAAAACIKAPSAENKEKLFKKLKKYAIVSVADPVLSHLAGMKVDKAKARKLAVDMIKNGTERYIVKFGIVLLGAYGLEGDSDLICTVGVHEEFTFFAVKAMRNLEKNDAYQQKLIELGKRTSGWGKVAVILEFDDKGLSYETKEWILRYGCRNDIGLHFTACECAIKGGLVQYLSEFSEEPVNKIPGAVDEEMTEGICDIIDGLLAGEPLRMQTDSASFRMPEDLNRPSVGSMIMTDLQEARQGLKI